MIMVLIIYILKSILIIIYHQKKMKLHNLITLIRSAIKNGYKNYPQVLLEGCLCKTAE